MRKREVDKTGTLTAEDLGKKLKVSPGTFATLEKKGKLPTSLNLGPRTTRWSVEVVQKWLTEDGGVV